MFDFSRNSFLLSTYVIQWVRLPTFAAIYPLCIYRLDYMLPIAQVLYLPQCMDLLSHFSEHCCFYTVSVGLLDADWLSLAVRLGVMG